MEWLKNLFGSKEQETTLVTAIDPDSDPGLIAIRQKISAAHKIHDNLLYEIEHEKIGAQRVRDTANEQAESILRSARAELEQLNKDIAAKRAEQSGE